MHYNSVSMNFTKFNTDIDTELGAWRHRLNDKGYPCIIHAESTLKKLTKILELYVYHNENKILVRLS